MLSLCQDVLSLLAGNEACTQHLQQSLLPMIANILQLPANDDHYGTQSVGGGDAFVGCVDEVFCCEC